MEFFSIIVPIVTYDLLESFETYQYFISYISSNEIPKDDDDSSRRLLAQDDSKRPSVIELLTDQTEALGYDSYNPMNNLGSISVIVFGYFFKMFIVFVFMMPGSWCSKKIKKKFMRRRRQLFFNNFFSIIFEAYFSIGLCSLLNIFAPFGDNDKNTTNTIISYSSLVVLLVFVPGSLIYVLVQPKYRLNYDMKFQRKWVKAYEDLSLRATENRLYRLLFCWRRFVFISSVYLLYYFPYFQLMLFMYTNLLVTIYQGQLKPLSRVFDNRLNLFNEFMVSTVVYISIIFSEMANSVDQKYFYGWMLMFIITFTFVINMMVVFLQTAKSLYLISIKSYVICERIHEIFIESDWYQENFVAQVTDKVEPEKEKSKKKKKKKKDKKEKKEKEKKEEEKKEEESKKI